jgi:hypothetical protein
MWFAADASMVPRRLHLISTLLQLAYQPVRELP